MRIVTFVIFTPLVSWCSTGIASSRLTADSIGAAGMAAGSSVVFNSFSYNGKVRISPGCRVRLYPSLVFLLRGKRRMPTVFLRINQTIPVVANTNAPITTVPRSCMPKGSNPPPYNRPFVVERLVTPSLAKIPTQRVPKIPQPRCTEVAPTGSSIFLLSKNLTRKTTKMPAIAPISRDTSIVTYAQLPVMANKSGQTSVYGHA